MDVYVTEHWPKYQVWADGVIIDEFTARPPRLTWSQMADVADGYRQALSAEDDTLTP